MSSEFFDDSDLGEGAGVDFSEVEPAAQQFAEQIAEQAHAEFVQRTDPLIAQRQSEAAEAQAALEAGVVQLVEEYPEFQQIAVAQPVVDDAHRAAVELGIPERADDPTFWREVHLARQAGARGAGVAYTIAEQVAKDQITNRSGGARGAGVLPFGGS